LQGLTPIRAPASRNDEIVVDSRAIAAFVQACADGSVAGRPDDHNVDALRNIAQACTETNCTMVLEAGYYPVVQPVLQAILPADSEDAQLFRLRHFTAVQAARCEDMDGDLREAIKAIEPTDWDTASGAYDALREILGSQQSAAEAALGATRDIGKELEARESARNGQLAEAIESEHLRFVPAAAITAKALLALVDHGEGETLLHRCASNGQRFSRLPIF
jgi:hypothetical protein